MDKNSEQGTFHLYSFLIGSEFILLCFFMFELIDILRLVFKKATWQNNGLVILVVVFVFLTMFWGVFFWNELRKRDKLVNYNNRRLLRLALLLPVLAVAAAIYFPITEQLIKLSF